MVADKDTHAGDSTPECVACAQPCVQEQTRWVCKCRGVLPDCIQRSFEALGLGGPPPAHDIRESKDSPVVGGFSPTLMSQNGLPYYLCVVRSNGIPQPGNIHHDDADAEQKTLERQGSSVSPQIDDSAHEYVPFGTDDTGDDQDHPDEDIDLEDVDEIDDNNEGAHIGSVDFWLQGTASMGRVERRSGIEHTLREVDILMPIPRTPSNKAQYGDEAELSDGMEIDE